MSFSALSEEEERIAREIVDAAYAVHKALGPGLLEKVYEVCFCHELANGDFVMSAKPRSPFSMITLSLMKDCDWMFWWRIWLSAN